MTKCNITTRPESSTQFLHSSQVHHNKTNTWGTVCKAQCEVQLETQAEVIEVKELQKILVPCKNSMNRSKSEI